MTDDKLKEKLLKSTLSQEMAKKMEEFVKEIFHKDAQYVADILEIPIDEKHDMICTEKKKSLALMYGVLTCQIQMMEKLKATMLAQIKNENSSLAEKLSNLKLH